MDTIVTYTAGLDVRKGWSRQHRPPPASTPAIRDMDAPHTPVPAVPAGTRNRCASS